MKSDSERTGEAAVAGAAPCSAMYRCECGTVLLRNTVTIGGSGCILNAVCPVCRREWVEICTTVKREEVTPNDRAQRPPAHDV